MARMLQQSLFTWQQVNAHSDLHRLRLVLDNIPDESLMRAMENHRGRGRNDYPIRAVWNSVLAGVVFQHANVEQLRRELRRNAELRQVCGFDLFQGSEAVPSASSYSRFLKILFSFAQEIDAIFKKLVDELREQLPDFGQQLGFDGKAIDSAGKPTQKAPGDGRRDTDATWGKHVYKGVRKDGTPWEKVKIWFGYKLHIVSDVVYELPVAYSVTAANGSEQKQLRALIDHLAKHHPELVERARTLVADKGLDATELIVYLFDEYDIKPVIAIRNMWREGGDEVAGSPTRQVFSERCDNIMYDYRGNVYCHCPVTHREHFMTYGGFERDRMTLKYICPARSHGASCDGAAECPHYRGHIRIPLQKNRRVFTPMPRSSYRWHSTYRRRAATERVNSRLEVSFGWERHFVRGLKKMKVRVGLSLIVMLAMALGHLKNNEREKIRSLIKRPELVRTG